MMKMRSIRHHMSILREADGQPELEERRVITVLIVMDPEIGVPSWEIDRPLLHI